MMFDAAKALSLSLSLSLSLILSLSLTPPISRARSVRLPKKQSLASYQWR